MKHSFSHDLDVETVRGLADKAFASYSETYAAYSPRIEWFDDHRARLGFSVKGMKVSGEFTIGERTLTVSIDVPFVFRLFRKKAVSIVEAELNAWIQRAK